MGIAFFIIRIDFMTGYLFNGVVRDMAASRYDQADLFQQVQADSGIAVSQTGQGPQHLIAGGNPQRTQAFLPVRQARRRTAVTACSDRGFNWMTRRRDNKGRLTSK